MGLSRPGWLPRRERPVRLFLGAHALTVRAVRTGDPDQRLSCASLAQACGCLESVLDARPADRFELRLGCAWSRLLLLPWVDALTNEQRWLNYARARYEQVFGDDAQHWEVRVAPALPGSDRVAASWPKAMQQSLAQRQDRVRSVRVDLLEHLGVLLRREPEFSGCIAEIHDDDAGFLLLVGGRVQRIRWCRFEDAQGLIAAVETEWAAVRSDQPAETDVGVACSLALAPPIPQPDSDRARAVAGLVTAMGFDRAFSLPDGF